MTENKSFAFKIISVITVVLAISEVSARSVYDGCHKQGSYENCFAIPPLLSTVDRCIDNRVIIVM